MIRRAGLKTAVLATALFFVAVWLGSVIGRPRAPNLGVELEDGFAVLEEGTFTVPEGKLAVFTGLGSRDCTIGPIVVLADGNEIARV